MTQFSLNIEKLKISKSKSKSKLKSRIKTKPNQITLINSNLILNAY